MNQLQMFDENHKPVLPVIKIHTHERTEEGTAFIKNQKNIDYAKTNCEKILRYWQRNNIWLNKYNAKDWLGVDCLAQRVKNLRASGIEIEKPPKGMFEGRQAYYRLKCTCKLIGGHDVIENCWAHDPSKRV